ncbi:hypothetical protein BU24DRAFT_280776 [Aaosphaeria arxii CBS 175.79]|uniref:Uncharacterized protein n=1 Tax=Aaosphaeria arxii CBS 175.79 TaxID=1450172 RepID=A0A6A5XEZ8_9PLEO|nr:uncharacterized protein BU24DRAFT_280776 [Aaosphaeria arxii CBS 175.79]KAF2011426.1 hypothetical protein BU24DRAFT_280776 [Aaosphaeria arxii CBS 175.79]
MRLSTVTPPLQEPQQERQYPLLPFNFCPTDSSLSAILEASKQCLPSCHNVFTGFCASAMKPGKRRVDLTRGWSWQRRDISCDILVTRLPSETRSPTKRGQTGCILHWLSLANSGHPCPCLARRNVITMDRLRRLTCQYSFRRDRLSEAMTDCNR